jgi:hypothetical protein
MAEYRQQSLLKIKRPRNFIVSVALWVFAVLLNEEKANRIPHQPRLDGAMLPEVRV